VGNSRHNADTYAYSGAPVYIYSLRYGIDDGFLTSFKVRQMASASDGYVYGGTDDVLAGEVEEGQAFTESDFNTKIVMEQRELSRVQEPDRPAAEGDYFLRDARSCGTAARSDQSGQRRPQPQRLPPRNRRR